MSSEQANDVERLIEAYLEGHLTGPERAAFERRLALDPDLRSEVRAQQSIDESLRAAFAPPVFADVMSWLGEPTIAGSPSPKLRVPFAQKPLAVRLLIEVAVAAAVGLVIGGAYVAWDAYRVPGGSRQMLAQQTIVEFYREREQRDFAEDWPCPPDRFRATFSYKLGVPVLMTEGPGVLMKGLAYSNTISPNTVNIMTKVGGRGVIVYADTGTLEACQRPLPESGLHLFERRLGTLNLYELTPLDQPHVLDLLYIPQPPATEPG